MCVGFDQAGLAAGMQARVGKQAGGQASLRQLAHEGRGGSMCLESTEVGDSSPTKLSYSLGLGGLSLNQGWPRHTHMCRCACVCLDMHMRIPEHDLLFCAAAWALASGHAVPAKLIRPNT